MRYFLILLLIGCFGCNNSASKELKASIKESNVDTLGFESIPRSKVMVIGSYHFRQENHYDELSVKNQIEIKKLVDRLAKFQPTKVVIEKLAKLDSIYNDFYKQYLINDAAIDTLPNETFQLGFRLAKQMGHTKVYLFDNKPVFIGSLKDFTWDTFNKKKDQDSLFVDRYRQIINTSFKNNEDKYKKLNLYNNIVERNSPNAQKWNAERMHSYEVRVGINDDWMGSDWLGRWYQRNIRMMAHIMKFNNPGRDRILIIVGDNHKWILDQLFEYNPEFDVVSSYQILK